MSKSKSMVFGLAFGALAVLCTATQPATAQDQPCQSVAQKRLQEYGLSPSDLTNVEWIAVRSGARQDGDVVSYHMWALPKGCTSGNLVVDMTGGCFITSVYTQGSCSVKGIPAY